MDNKVELEKHDSVDQDFVEYRIRFSRRAILELNLDSLDQRLMKDCDSPDASIADRVLMLQVLAYRIEQQTKMNPEAPPIRLGNPNDMVWATREHARKVLFGLMDVIGDLGKVSLADLKTLAGLSTIYLDEKWGWKTLDNAVNIVDARDGFRIIFPTMVKL